MKAIGKWLSIAGAIASAVIGAVGPATLPTAVRTVLIVIGAVAAAFWLASRFGRAAAAAR